MALAPVTSELGLDGAVRSVWTTTAPMFASPAMHVVTGQCLCGCTEDVVQEYA